MNTTRNNLSEDCIVTLIASIDDETEERTEILATRESAGQKEFFAAAQSGFRAECKLTVRYEEYEGQEFAELLLHGRKKRLYIYRTYDRDDGKTELYLTGKAGVFGGNQR